MNDFQKLLKTLMFAPCPNGWGVPTLFTGAPGIGKTAQLAALTQLGLPVYVLIGSTCDPTDVRGLQVVQPDGTAVSAKPHWVRYVQEHGGIILLDEFNLAPPAMQAAMLRAINERSFGEHYLGPLTRFIAVQNPLKQARNGWTISQPMCNRFAHLDWPAPELGAWTDYMGGRAFPQWNTRETTLLPADTSVARALEADVQSRYAEHYDRVCMAYAGFLRAQPQLFSATPTEGQVAWPTPRTNDLAVRALAAAEMFGLALDTTDTLLSGIVGSGAATQFAAWRYEANLPDARALLDGKITWEPGSRLDVNYAVAAGVTAAYLSDPMHSRYTDSWCDVMHSIGVNQPDLIVQFLLSAQRAQKLPLSVSKPKVVALARILQPYLNSGIVT